jgi:hypothetical protein
VGSSRTRSTIILEKILTDLVGPSPTQQRGIASVSEQAHGPAVTADNQPVAVILISWTQAGPAGGLCSARQNTWLNESGGEGLRKRHTAILPACTIWRQPFARLSGRRRHESTTA